MKKIAGIVTSILLALAVTSCYKDLGSYDYKDINALIISADMSVVDPQVFITADSIDLRQNDSLKVKLKIDQSADASDELMYEWIVTQYSQSSLNPSEHIIATTPELATKIVLAPNLYRLTAKVTDKKSGVSFYKTFALNVAAAPWGGEGWIVLQDEPDGADISVITTRDGSVKGEVYHNVYSVFNGHKLPVGTYKVNVINYSTVLRAQKVSFLYPNGALQVRSIDFADSTKGENWFAGYAGPMNFQANSSAGGSSAGWEYTIINDQIAYRQMGGTAALVKPPLFFPPYEGVTISPFVINGATSDNFYTLYDKVNRGFVLFNASNSSFVTIPNYTKTAVDLSSTGQGFDLKRMNDNLVHAENAQPLAASTVSFHPYWDCFFRNDAGTNTYVVQFLRGTAYKNDAVSGRYNLVDAVEKCPGINTATKFAVPTFLPMPGGKFYYVNGSSVFTCTLSTPQNSSTAVAQINYPAGTIIKTMKVFNSGYTPANITSLGIPEGRVLVVATDETASGGGHNVYFYNLGFSGDIASSPTVVYNGFSKITDIVFKKALGR